MSAVVGPSTSIRRSTGKSMPDADPASWVRAEQIPEYWNSSVVKKEIHCGRACIKFIIIVRGFDDEQ